MDVLCATSEKNALTKKSTAVKLKASDYVGLPNYCHKNAISLSRLYDDGTVPMTFKSERQHDEHVGLPYVRVSPDTSSFSAPVRASGRVFRKLGVVRVLHIGTADDNMFQKFNTKRHWYILNLHKTP